MYGLSSEVDLGFFKGQELIQVCVGRYQLQFNFDTGDAVSVESRAELQDATTLRLLDAWTSTEPFRTTEIFDCIGHSVDRVEWKTDGTLSFSFENHRRLTIFDSSKEYESYTVNHGGDVIVV